MTFENIDEIRKYLMITSEKDIDVTQVLISICDEIQVIEFELQKQIDTLSKYVSE